MKSNIYAIRGCFENLTDFLVGAFLEILQNDVVGACRHGLGPGEGVGSAQGKAIAAPELVVAALAVHRVIARVAAEVVRAGAADEPHHPQKYANKLDYAIKLKQFFDHHLKGEPAPAWMTEGVPYKGE